MNISHQIYPKKYLSGQWIIPGNLTIVEICERLILDPPPKLENWMSSCQTHTHPSKFYSYRLLLSIYWFSETHQQRNRQGWGHSVISYHLFIPSTSPPLYPHWPPTFVHGPTMNCYLCVLSSHKLSINAITVRLGPRQEKLLVYIQRPSVETGGWTSCRRIYTTTTRFHQGWEVSRGWK